MGCRHTQSMLNMDPKPQITVLEPSNEIFISNVARIGATIDDIILVKSLDELNINIDFAIIATSSQPRFEIVKSLLDKGIKLFLLEKVVFQSEGQFKEIIKLLEDSGAKAYCNFVQRYYPNYRSLKKSIDKTKKINMVVNGGDFGLGCNALHYIDLFEYLTESKVILKNFQLSENQSGNKRGNIYKEFFGQLTFVTENGSSLWLLSQSDKVGGVQIHLDFNKSKHLLCEETLHHYQVCDDGKVLTNKFEILFTSNLTAVIYEDLLNGSSLLPSVQDVANIHTQFFKAINSTLNKDEWDNCPIT